MPHIAIPRPPGPGKQEIEIQMTINGKRQEVHFLESKTPEKREGQVPVFEHKVFVFEQPTRAFHYVFN